MIFNIENYADLKRALNLLDESQLQQHVQFMEPGPDGDSPIPLGVVLAIGTVQDFCATEGGECDKTRSSIDNQHHPEHLVLLVDGNPFSKDGVMAYDLFTGKPVMKVVDDDSNGEVKP